MNNIKLFEYYDSEDVPQIPSHEVRAMAARRDRMPYDDMQKFRQRDSIMSKLDWMYENIVRTIPVVAKFKKHNDINDENRHPTFMGSGTVEVLHLGDVVVEEIDGHEYEHNFSLICQYKHKTKLITLYFNCFQVDIPESSWNLYGINESDIEQLDYLRKECTMSKHDVTEQGFLLAIKQLGKRIQALLDFCQERFNFQPFS